MDEISSEDNYYSFFNQDDKWTMTKLVTSIDGNVYWGKYTISTGQYFSHIHGHFNGDTVKRSTTLEIKHLNRCINANDWVDAPLTGSEYICEVTGNVNDIVDSKPNQCSGYINQLQRLEFFKSDT